MKSVGIAEGKKSFSRLIRDAADKKEEVLIIKRGKPVAVIVPYEKYMKNEKLEGFKSIMEVRDAFLKTGLSATDIYLESREQLTGLP
jgi:prevent-host-death family protein